MDKDVKEPFVIQIMCKLSVLPNDSTQWTEESTDQLCELCDIVGSLTVAKCLMDYNVITIAQTIMENEHLHDEIPRLMELLVCLLNNLCCYGDIHATLVSSDDVTLAILSLFSKSDDAEFLKETFRYIFTLTNDVPRQVNLNDSWYTEAAELPSDPVSQDAHNESASSSDKDSTTPPVAEVSTIFESILCKFMTGQDALLKLMFILKSSTNTELLEKALEFLNYICVIPDRDEKLFSHYLPSCEVVGSLIEALEQIEANESISVAIPRYFASILASFVHGEHGKVSLMNYQPTITMAFCRLLTYYFLTITEDVVKIYNSYMVDGKLLSAEMLTKLLWVFDEVTKPPPEDGTRSWEYMIRHEEEDIHRQSNSTVEFCLEDHFHDVLVWSQEQKGVIFSSEIDEALFAIQDIIVVVDDSS